MADDHHLLALLLVQCERMERKLDTLLQALAMPEESEDEGAVRSLDGDLFPTRDERKALR